MSFPASFGSQLAAVMEALLKAVVAEVTALVEDGAVELRLELRDRDREIREKERQIEQRDRDILELRAAVEELRARKEESVSAGEEEREEQTPEEQSQVWTKDEDLHEPVVKSEPEEEFTIPDPDLNQSLWPPSPLSAATTSNMTPAAATCVYDSGNASTAHETQNYHIYYSEQVREQDFSPTEQSDLPLDSLLDENQEQFYAQKPGLFAFPVVQNRACNGKRRIRLNFGDEFRCDQCGKTFTARKRLMSHQSVHTGAKPFSCKDCGKMFSRRDNCVRHEKSHKQ
ncbi:hypothetical protein WMY93_000630 [Mugilogobius chulae]|uniref:C2H2-type domain-containing protein n=1 Tax=Mugilogobius chulae TaxID=88201 RepID=A0AAW0Q2K9_9GOBI